MKPLDMIYDKKDDAHGLYLIPHRCIKFDAAMGICMIENLSNALGALG